MLTLRISVQIALVVGLLQPQLAVAQDRVSFGKVSFYFAAHEDDWQLFMNPSAFQDVGDDKTKTVFVHLTAGDAGLGTGTGGRKHPYYLARENGAQTAIRFMADSGNQPLDKIDSLIRLNGHQLYRSHYRNTVTYFLRLPDGHPTGNGFTGTGNQSLKRLATGQITNLIAVDNTAIYRGWADVVSTVRSLLDFERGRSPSIQLNVAEQDSSINSGDHSDHLMTSKAVLDSANGLACARRVYYVDYASSELPTNLDPQDRDMESSVLAVTASGLLALDHTSIWQQYYRGYLGRNYFRTDEAAGICEPAPSAKSFSASADGKLIGKRRGQ